MSNNPSLEPLIREVDQMLLESLLQGQAQKECHPRLFAAMVYMLRSGGKRVRPLLALAGALAARKDASEQVKKKWAKPAMLAVEYIHTYSLIHDDLPALDDDDMRRNKPSCHVQFDEATAILAGDAFLSDAFLVLSSAAHNPLEQCKKLALIIGRHGLISGQMSDLFAESETADCEEWLSVYRKKTALLFQVSLGLGALAVDADAFLVRALEEMGTHLGMAFQFLDDVDDQAPLFRLLGRKEMMLRASKELAQAQNLMNELPGDRELLQNICHTFFNSRIDSHLL